MKKKIFARFISTTFIFALLFSVSVQAQSWQEMLDDLNFPTSYNYSFELSVELDKHGDVDDDIAAVVSFFSDGFTFGMSGTHVRDGLATSDFMQIDLDLGQILAAIPMDIPIMPMVALMGIDLAEPFRFWVETDFTSLLAPEMKMVIELPPVLRLALGLVDESLMRQFIVLDMTDLMQEILVEIDAEIRTITEEQVSDFMYYFEEAMEEIMSVLEEFQLDFEEWMAEAWEEVGQFFEIRVFEYGTERLENAVSSFIELNFTVSDDISAMDFFINFNASVTDMNSAERVPLPILTPENSFRPSLF